MSSPYDKADTTQAGYDDRRPLPPEGEHLIIVEDTSDFRGTQMPKALYYKVNYRLHQPQVGSCYEDGTPARAGTQHAYMEKMDQHSYESHAVKAIASVKGFVGACFGIGLDDQDRLSREVTSRVIEGTTKNRALLNSSVLRVVITHKTYTKMRNGQAKQEKIAIHQFFPVLDSQGQPLKIKVAMSELPPSSAPGTPAAGAGAPPAPPSAPPPPPPAAAAFPPAGWLTHPNGTSYYKAGMPVAITEADLRTLIATGQA